MRTLKIFLLITTLSNFVPGIVSAWQAGIAFKKNAAPRNLTYLYLVRTYTKWTAITTNTPSYVGGAPTTWNISPALPAGLSFNTTNGNITGTPTVAPTSGTYTVTASNLSGSTSVNLSIDTILSGYTWTGNAAPSKSWAAGGNWYGGSAPNATGIAIFDNECGANCAAEIDTSITLYEIRMKSNYTGTITQVGANTIALGTNNGNTPYGIRMDGGTFVGGSGNIRADVLNISAGTFTATTGELRIGFDALSSINSTQGFTLSAIGTFNHNNGTVYVDTETNSSGGRRAFTFDVETAATFYNLELDGEDQSADQNYNSTYFSIAGTAATIQVMNDFKMRDGFVQTGNIKFYGATASFYCDGTTSQDKCGSYAPGVANYPSSGFGFIPVFEFCGSTPQSLWFEDGAGVGQLKINNSTGVTTGGAASDFRVVELNINDGLFTPPSYLRFMEGFSSAAQNTTIGFTVGTLGSFAHNNGTVAIEPETPNSDSRTPARFVLASNTITLYNLILDIYSDNDNNSSGYENVRMNIPTAYTINIANDLTVKNGGFDSSSGSTAKFVISGDYSRECSSPTSYCADIDANVSKDFIGAGSNITIAEGPENDCTGCTLTVNPGAGNTIYFNGFWPLRNTTADLIITSGTFHLNAGSGIGIGDDLVNNSAITCAGGAYIQYLDALTGTPGGGNNPACYTTTPGDAFPDAIDWVDFSGTSTVQTFTNFHNIIRIQISNSVISGAPTMRYRLSGGSNAAWSNVTAPTTLIITKGMTMELNMSGVSGESGTFTVTNTTGGGGIDTAIGTVP